MSKHKLLLAIFVPIVLGVAIGFANRNLLSDLGRGAAISIREEKPVSFGEPNKLILFNPYPHRVHVVGYSASCSCVVTEEIPAAIDGLSAISVSFDRAITPGSTIQFFVDRPSAYLGWEFK